MNHFWDITLFTIQETPISVVNLLTCLFILVISFALAKGVKNSVVHISALKNAMSVSALYGIGRLSHYAILLIGIYVALTTIGINLTGIAMVIGALSVGIGFGLQSIFNNFIAGIIVLIEKKVRINDRIQLELGDIGIVIEINVRTVVIQAPDNRKIVIPNSEIISKKVSNWNQDEGFLFRLRLPFSVERKVEKEMVKQVVLEALKSLPMTFQKIHPDVWLTKVSEMTQEFEAIVWVFSKEVGLGSQSLSAPYLWALESAFTKKEIKLLEANRILSNPSPMEEL